MTQEELDDYFRNLMETFKGDLTDLADAVGALNLGKVYGWKVLRIIYSPVTYRKYQKILGLDFKEVLEDKTDFSERNRGYKIALELNKYWEIVQGAFSIDSKEKRVAVSI
jgi:hypothetical protein